MPQSGDVHGSTASGSLPSTLYEGLGGDYQRPVDSGQSQEWFCCRTLNHVLHFYRSLADTLVNWSPGLRSVTRAGWPDGAQEDGQGGLFSLFTGELLPCVLGSHERWETPILLSTWNHSTSYWCVWVSTWRHWPKSTLQYWKGDWATSLTDVHFHVLRLETLQFVVSGEALVLSHSLQSFVSSAGWYQDAEATSISPSSLLRYLVSQVSGQHPNQATVSGALPSMDSRAPQSTAASGLGLNAEISDVTPLLHCRVNKREFCGMWPELDDCVHTWRLPSTRYHTGPCIGFPPHLSLQE